MTQSDDESVLSSAPSAVTTPFSIAAKSTTSSLGPQKNTRNRGTRIPVVQKSIKSPPPYLPPPPRAVNDYSSLQTIPTSQRTNADILVDAIEVDAMVEEPEQEQESFIDPDGTQNLHTPGPGSSVSQSSGSSLKRQRVFLSDVWSQASIEQRLDSGYIKYNYYRKSYKYTRGIKNIKDYLKREYK